MPYFSQVPPSATGPERVGHPGGKRRRALGASLSASLAASALLATASPARAEPTRVVNVLELVADFDDTNTAQAVTNLLRLRVNNGGDFALASDNTSFGVTALAVRCDTQGLRARPLSETADASIDARCLRSVGAHLGSKGYFWGHVYHDGGGRLGVKLHLWSADGSDRSKALSLEGGGRERLVARLYEHLVHPEHAADVRLGGVPVDQSGELYVDGKAEGAYSAGDEVTVKDGEHQFELRREGKAIARAKASVAAGRLNDVRLERVAAPAPIEAAQKRVEIPTTPVEPRGEAWKRPAGFVGIGLGAALLGVGIFSSLRVRSLSNDFDEGRSYVAYRSAPGRSGDDACDAAKSGFASALPGAASPSQVRDLCSKSSTFQTLQYVGYGGAAVFAGVGAYLLITSRGKRSAAPSSGMAWQLAPSVGPSSAGAALSVRF